MPPSLATENRFHVSPGAGALALSFALVALVALADYLTGYEVRLSILYLVPISLASWKLGRGAGAVMAVSAALCWLVTFSSSHPYSDAVYFYWEAAITGATFLIMVLLLARLREALERSDDRFLTVLEGLDAAVNVEDARSGELLYGNRRFRELPAGFRLAREDGEVCDPATQAWYQVHSRPLRWTDGRAAVLRVLSDITEERRAREMIARHREAAHRTSRLVALGGFASALAHELNQPLAAVATYNEACLRLLESGSFDAAELQGAMRKCRDQARRAGAIIQRLREVLRQPVATRAECDLGEIARAALELAEPEAREAGVELELRAAAGLPAVRTDRVLAEQVALNLIRNAIEAVQGLERGRRRVTVEIALGADGKAALSVSDLGDGIPEEVRGRLFEAFVSTKPGGLGLGLSICRSVIESLGGEIRCEGVPAGARFSFSLPREER